MAISLKHTFYYITTYAWINTAMLTNIIYRKDDTIRGFSTLSAPPVNGGVPKANGPVPNEM